MPMGVVTDMNWWVDGHAEKHRQRYLKWLSSAHAAAPDKLKKVDDSQTKGKPSLLCFRAKSRPTLFRTKLSIQPEKEGKKK